jgi:SAM-dependent methyltransferase
MKIETISHGDNVYPKYTSNGNATRFYESFALEVCKGFGVDVGCNRIDWMFNNKFQREVDEEWVEYNLSNKRITNYSSNDTYTFPIDPVLNDYSATNFPFWCENLDFIYSSNCLEHIPNYIEVLEYFKSKLTDDGTLFLALPHPDQSYHRPESNKKHIHLFHPKNMVECLEYMGFKNIFCSQRDLYWGFSVFCNK